MELEKRVTKALQEKLDWRYTPYDLCEIDLHAICMLVIGPQGFSRARR